MTRLVIPVLLVIFAGFLSFYVTAGVINGSDNPLIHDYLLGSDGKGIKELRAESGKLSEALENANKLIEKGEKLNEDMNKLPQDKLERLDKFLPDNIDNVDLLVDLNGIANRHGMTLKSVKFTSPEGEEGASAQTVSNSAIGESSLSFSVTGSYEKLLGFVSDLANSLRVVDVKSLSFTVDEKELNQYNVELKTYWIK